METSHQIYIILMLIIIVSTGESGLSPQPSTLHHSTPVAEPHRGPEGCHFPAKWEANWFQSGIHQTITINRNTINIKGKCLETDGEKYLVHNEKENCFRCIVFHEKHFNLLQYKETMCIPERASIRSVCDRLTSDDNLFTMIRLGATPIDCPFRAPMSFTYNRGNGECKSPISNVDSCLESSKVLFNYQACPDIHGTESTSEQLECYATFKEGSSRYLIGLMAYRHHASYEDRFRCFAYEKKGSLGLMGLSSPYANTVARSSPLTFNSNSSSSSSSSLSSTESNSNSQNAILFRLSQSADANCYGFERTMTFRRVIQAQKQCYFPAWLQLHPRWHTLDQRTIFTFNSSMMRMTTGNGSVVGEVKDGNSQAKTIVGVCSEIVENPSPDEYMLVLHTTSAQCRNGYMCTRIVRRDTHIVEMQMGTLSRQLDEACHPTNFNPKLLPYTTLTSSNSGKKRCPSLGHFGITSLAQEGRSVRDSCKEGHRSFSVGCSSRNTMEFHVLCKSDALPQVISEYSCHGWWEEEGINYLITTLTSRRSSLEGQRRYCFIYKEVPLLPSLRKTYLGSNDHFEDFGRIMQFSSIADSCRRDVSPGIEGFLAFNVTSKGRCNDISGSSIPSLVTDLWLLATIIQMLFLVIL